MLAIFKIFIRTIQTGLVNLSAYEWCKRGLQLDTIFRRGGFHFRLFFKLISKSKPTQPYFGQVEEKNRYFSKETCTKTSAAEPGSFCLAGASEKTEGRPQHIRCWSSKSQPVPIRVPSCMTARAASAFSWQSREERWSYGRRWGLEVGICVLFQARLLGKVFKLSITSL